VKELDIIEQKLGSNQTTEKLIFGTKAKEFYFKDFQKIW
jgi:hypothetical protein